VARASCHKCGEPGDVIEFGVVWCGKCLVKKYEVTYADFRKSVRESSTQYGNTTRYFKQTTQNVRRIY
jgi:hypothetical protein